MKFRHLVRVGILAGLVVATFSLQGPLFSQSEPAASEQAAPAGEERQDQPANDNQSLKLDSEWYRDPAIWVIIGLGLLVIAVAVDRGYIIYRKNRGSNAELVQYLAESLHERRLPIDQIAAEIGQEKFGLEGRVAASALKGWEFGVETMEQYAHTALTAERRNLERRLVILNTLGNNIPFIGLLGTVLGIMQAFGDLADLGADAGPSVVMKGISSALIATAAGLIAAVPTVIFYNGLSKGARNKVSMAEEIVSLLKAIRLSTPR